MRMTLTIKSDGAARREKLRMDQNRSLEDLVNELLGRGLDCLDLHGPKAQEHWPAYRIKPVAARSNRSNLDDIVGVLCVTEGEDHR